MKKSYKKRNRKRKGGNQTRKILLSNELRSQIEYLLAITKDGKEEIYNVKYTGPIYHPMRGSMYKFELLISKPPYQVGHVFKMKERELNTDNARSSWKLYVSSRTSIQAAPIPFDPSRGGGKSYKKRNRKRSTKKRARRRTRKAGTKHSELAQAVMRRRFQERQHRITNTPGAIRNLQALPLNNPDADHADSIVMNHMRRQPQHVGMHAARAEAQRKARLAREAERATRNRDYSPSFSSITLRSDTKKRGRAGSGRKKTKRRRKQKGGTNPIVFTGKEELIERILEQIGPDNVGAIFETEEITNIAETNEPPVWGRDKKIYIKREDLENLGIEPANSNFQRLWHTTNIIPSYPIDNNGMVSVHRQIQMQALNAGPIVYGVVRIKKKDGEWFISQDINAGGYKKKSKKRRRKRKTRRRRRRRR